MSSVRLKFLVGLLAIVLIAFSSVSAFAQSREQTIVDRARATLEAFVKDPEATWFRDGLKKAKAVLIVPRQLKAAFIFSASGGNGVAFWRDEKTNKWSQPAFYTMGAGGVGIQIGAQVSEVVLLMMTERGQDALLSNKVQLGADISVAAGVGSGAQAATSDVISYSRSKGVFAGVSLEGSVISPRNGMNEAYYGKPVRARDILVKQDASNPNAAALVSAIDDAADPAKAATPEDVIRKEERKEKAPTPEKEEEDEK